jgi:hypothetical protein
MARVVVDRVPVYVVPHGDYLVLGFLDSGDEVPVFSRSVSRNREEDWLGIPDVGWIENSPDAIDLSISADQLEPLPLQTAALHPVDVRTGVAVVDIVIEAATRADPGRLEALLLFRTQPCVERRTYPDSPPQCPDGIDEGASVEVFPVSYSQGAQLGRAEMHDLLARLLTRRGTPLRLYAVLDLRGTTAERADRRYRVIFGYEVGGSLGFSLAPSGMISVIIVGESGDSPGWKLGAMTGAEPVPHFIVAPPIPPPLRAAVGP